MKYRIARELIEKIETFDEIDGDLIIFKKPYTKAIRFTFKDDNDMTVDLKDYSYISLSNHGFLFIRQEPYETNAIHLNNVEDLIVI